MWEREEEDLEPGDSEQGTLNCREILKVSPGDSKRGAVVCEESGEKHD